MSVYRKLLCLDFDGVISSYSSGWKGADVIPDPPVPDAMEFLREAVKHFDVNIYSSRSGQPGGIEAMQDYLLYELEKKYDNDAMRIFKLVEWPTEKPPAHLSIDDRALLFTGEWPTMEFMESFKPWNKKDPQ